MKVHVERTIHFEPDEIKQALALFLKEAGHAAPKGEGTLSFERDGVALRWKEISDVEVK